MIQGAYRNPIYNLKAVVEKTGVSADALRAWERRYGLPEPARTDAGHRVYSRRDIDVIRWLVARQDEGLRIGRAVKLWWTIEREGQDPLQSMPLPSDTRKPDVVAGNTIDDLREAWLSASLGFDERGAEQALTRAFAMYPPEVVCSRIIADGIARIGDKWCKGEATPQQEHFASQLAVRRLERLIAATPPPTRRGRIVTASPAGEEHTIGLLTMTLLLRRAGWDVVYLGADTPLEQMAETLEATEADLIIMVAQQLNTAMSVLEMARVARRQELAAAFGGRVFDQEPKVRDRIPGHFLGSAFDEAVRETERLMTTARRIADVEPLSAEDEKARSHYLDKRKAMESEVWTTLRAQAFDARTLLELNETMGQSIEAGLAFGDIDLASRQLDWLEGLDGCHSPYSEQIAPFIRAYYRAAQKHLNERGAVIVDWLADRVSEEVGATG